MKYTLLTAFIFLLMTNICRADPDLSGAYDFMFVEGPTVVITGGILLFIFLARRSNHPVAYFFLVISIVLGVLSCLVTFSFIGESYLSEKEKSEFPMYFGIMTLTILFAIIFIVDSAIRNRKKKKAE